jgi:hypothetical protein
MQACLAAGIKMGGYHAGAGAGVWSYQLGPCSGIDFADQLWASRYVLMRVSEGGGVGISFERSHPDTAIQLRCRVKFSTRDTRDTAIGLMALQQQVARLEASHAQHVAAYSKGGSCALSEPFSCSKGGKSPVGAWAAASCAGPRPPAPGGCQRISRQQGRAAALRCGTAAPAWLPAHSPPPSRPPLQVMIPTKTVMQKAGHLVDNRPPASMDPYLATALLLASCLGMPLPMAAATAPAAQSQQQQVQQQQQMLCKAAACAPIPIPRPHAAPRLVQLPKSASPQGSYRSGPLSSHPSSIPTPNVSMPHPAAVMSLGTMQQLMALQMQQRLSSQQRAGASPAPSCSWNSGDSDGCSTLNSQDVLIDELQKFDQLSPGTPPYQQTLTYAAECSDECSDGTSPETHPGPLSCAARSEVMW